MNDRFRSRRLRPALITALAVVWSAVAIAEETTLEATVSPPPSALRTIEEIVVTATKREEALRAIPASISAVSGADLEAEAAGDLQDYLGKVTGISQNRSSVASSRIAIRGVGFETMPGAATLQTTGILINDAGFNDPFINSVTADVYAFDLSSVEVLKGPQGTLFGAASLGGAVRYVLAEPVPGEREAKLFTQYTSREDGGTAVGYGIAVNTPLWSSEDHAVRVVWIDRDVPGLYDDQRHGDRDVDAHTLDNLRAQFLWAPDAPYEVKLLYMKQRFHGFGVGFADNTKGRLSYSNQLVPHDDLPAPTAFELASVELGWEFDTMRLGSYTHRTHKETDTIVELTRQFGTNPPPDDGGAVLFHVVQDITGITEELRLQSTTSGSLEWLVGAYGFFYDHYSFVDLYTEDGGPDTGATDFFVPGIGAIENPTAVGTSPTLLVGTFPADATELALFGETTYRLWDRIDLTAGLRVYRTRVEGGTRDSRGVLIAALNNGMELNKKNEIEERGVNPKLAFLCDLSEVTSIYGNLARGFRFGGVQLVPTTTGTSTSPATYASDALWSLEVGVRNTLLDETMHFDVAGFGIDWNDPQIQLRDPTTSVNFTSNASGARIYGGEASFLYLPPIEGLTLSAGASYTRARIDETFIDGNGVEIPEGTPLPGTPEWQAVAGIAYATMLGGVVSAEPSLAYNYSSKAYNTLTREVPILDYGVLHANLNLGLPDRIGTPRFTINVFNLLNERAVTNAWFTAADPEDSIDTWYLPTRTLNLRLDLSF